MPRNGSLTKDLLVETFVDMVGASKEITVKALVAQAGVNRQTFYYHFATIEDLIAYACNTKVRATFNSVVAESGKRGGFDVLVGFVDEYRTPARYLLYSKGRAWLRALFYEESISMTRRMVDRLLGDEQGIAEKERDDVAAYCTIACASILEMWVTDVLRESPAEISRMLETGLRNAAYGLLAKQP